MLRKRRRGWNARVGQEVEEEDEEDDDEDEEEE